MGLFDFLKEDNTNIEKQVDNSSNTSITSLFSNDTAINEESVLKIPTVQSCKELISSTIAQLPIYLYKETEDGSVEKIADDYRLKLLNEEPNEFQTAYNFKKQIVNDYLFYGASYTYVERERNHIHELINLKTKSVRVDKYIKDGFKVVDADINLVSVEDGRSVNNKTLNTFKPYECIVVLKDSNDGIT